MPKKKVAVKNEEAMEPVPTRGVSEEAPVSASEAPPLDVIPENTTVTAPVDPVVVSSELAELSVKFFGMNSPVFFIEKVGEKTLEGHRYDTYRASDGSTYDIPVA